MSTDIETATTAISSAPDPKTRRYDRQLRLWAASGQSALESARILVISASATSTQVLKNLVLPGVGHFTILDPGDVSAADAGNNFFFDGPKSIGKKRAEEAAKFLCELNESVDGAAEVTSLEDVLEHRPEYITSFSLVIAHNLESGVLDRLANLLWASDVYPPLFVIRSAGFLAEFFIQFHEHTVIESHSETAPSLRIDKPFPALVEHALSLDFAGMDPTDHGHIPYVIILVRALSDWKVSHDGAPPKTYAEKQAFKQLVASMKRKPDEENFEEAEAQAYRCWAETCVPSTISALFNDPRLAPASGAAFSPFFRLLAALSAYTTQHGLLPLSPVLPDMKASTEEYVRLQVLYKTQAAVDKAAFVALLKQQEQEGQTELVPVPEDMVDAFVKNAHALELLRGTRWGALDTSPEAFATALSTSPKEAATHFALSALAQLQREQTASASVSDEALRAGVQALVGAGVELPEEVDDAVGEIARASNADLPNVAAFVGGLVAQEAIKVITQQYVPVKGYCVIDLVETRTAILEG